MRLAVMARPGPGRPDYLRKFAGECVRKVLVAGPVAETAVRDLFTFTSLVASWSWASGCSGTDSPSWSFQALHEALLTEPCGHDVTFRHVCSAEIDAAKREFVKASVKPAMLLRDLFDMTKATAVDDVIGGTCSPLAAMAGLG